MIQNFDLNTYNYEKWNNKRGSDLLKEKMTEFELTDIWRIKNNNTKRFSWWKKTPRQAGRLDYFLISEQLTSTVGKVDILSPYKSHEEMGPGLWKLNSELLKDKNLQTKIKEELKLIKRTYALTPYEQDNLELIE